MKISHVSILYLICVTKMIFWCIKKWMTKNRKICCIQTIIIVFHRVSIFHILFVKLFFMLKYKVVYLKCYSLFLFGLLSIQYNRHYMFFLFFTQRLCTRFFGDLQMVFMYLSFYCDLNFYLQMRFKQFFGSPNIQYPQKNYVIFFFQKYI